MSIIQGSGNPAPGDKEPSKYTENYYRCIVASFDLAASIILQGKMPKERDQYTKLDSSLHNDSMLMKGYRAALRQAYEKPDSFLDPLLPFIQDATDALPQTLSAPADRYSPVPGKMDLQDQIRRDVRDGRLQRLYHMRGDVEEWVRGTVADVFDTLEKHSIFDRMTGQQLVHATILLRLMYGQILAGLSPYCVDDPERLHNERVFSFAANAISEIRNAMILETLRRFDEDARLEGAHAEFMTLALQLGAGRIKIEALSPRSQFDSVRANLRCLKEDRHQLAEIVADHCAWNLFTEYGVPHVAEFGRRPAQVAARTSFFIPGQLVFVTIPQDSKDPIIYGAFDTQSGTRSVAASCDPLDGGFRFEFPLSGIGLPHELSLSASHAAGMRLDDSGKPFPTWAHLLAPLPNPQLAGEIAEAVGSALNVQEQMLASLWSEEPELLKILSEDEATVVAFEAGRVVVLGTCLPGNDARQAFFSMGESLNAVEYAQRAKITFGGPALWFARVLRAEQLPAPTSSGGELTAEELRERDRKALREVVSRCGAMNYRTFVSTLSSWDVLDTNEGRGGHGSLLRIVNGSELRSGTWGKLRDPDHNMNFIRIYEILDRLQIPVGEYTDWLSKNR